MRLIRRLLNCRRRYRARRGFRQNYSAWKATGDKAAWLNLTILAERLKQLDA